MLQYEIKKPEGMDEKEFRECLAGYMMKEELIKDFKGRAS